MKQTASSKLQLSERGVDEVSQGGSSLHVSAIIQDALSAVASTFNPAEKRRRALRH